MKFRRKIILITVIAITEIVHEVDLVRIVLEMFFVCCTSHYETPKTHAEEHNSFFLEDESYACICLSGAAKAPW